LREKSIRNALPKHSLTESPSSRLSVTAVLLLPLPVVLRRSRLLRLGRHVRPLLAVVAEEVAEEAVGEAELALVAQVALVGEVRRMAVGREVASGRGRLGMTRRRRMRTTRKRSVSKEKYDS